MDKIVLKSCFYMIQIFNEIYFWTENSSISGYLEAQRKRIENNSIFTLYEK